MERGSTRSPSVVNSIWKRLRTCLSTEYSTMIFTTLLWLSYFWHKANMVMTSVKDRVDISDMYHRWISDNDRPKMGYEGLCTQSLVRIQLESVIWEIEKVFLQHSLPEKKRHKIQHVFIGHWTERKKRIKKESGSKEGRHLFTDSDQIWRG